MFYQKVTEWFESSLPNSTKQEQKNHKLGTFEKEYLPKNHDVKKEGRNAE